jgi:hypothetical protein
MIAGTGNRNVFIGLPNVFMDNLMKLIGNRGQDVDPRTKRKKEEV